MIEASFLPKNKYNINSFREVINPAFSYCYISIPRVSLNGSRRLLS